MFYLKNWKKLLQKSPQDLTLSGALIQSLLLNSDMETHKVAPHQNCLAKATYNIHVC